MRIAEIFASRQGEGLLTGTTSVFIRTSGCNLRCWYCDTPYTSWSPEGDDLSVAEIMERVDALAEDHAVITGGEPMLFAELIPLADQLHAGGRHITIETAGTLYLPIACDLMSISPKLAGSGPEEKEYPTWSRRHERTRHAPDVIRRLIAEHEYQIKFVVDTPQDCRSVETYLAELKQIDRGRVMLMPQGVDGEELERQAEWLEPYCREHGLLFCPRKHIEWYGNVRGT